MTMSTAAACWPHWLPPAAQCSLARSFSVHWPSAQSLPQLQYAWLCRAARTPSHCTGLAHLPKASQHWRCAPAQDHQTGQALALHLHPRPTRLGPAILPRTSHPGLAVALELFNCFEVINGCRLVEATPEVTSMQLQPTHQFIMMGSDGVFDVLDDEEVVTTVQVCQHACCWMPSLVAAAL